MEGNGTAHEQRVKRMMVMHQLMMQRLAAHGPHEMEGTDLEKLEKAYERLRGYAFVLKKA